MKAVPKSQRAMYDEASRKLAEINETFLEMLPTMRRRELEKLIEKRPALWGRFAGYLTSGHVFADDPPAKTSHHATKKSPAQLQREIDEALAQPRTQGHARSSSSKKSLTAPRNIDVHHPEFVSEGALRGFGRKAFHRGYTLEGAYTFAAAAVGRRLDENELDAVADGWNAENVGGTRKRGTSHAHAKRSASKRAHATVKSEDASSAEEGPTKENLQRAAKWIRRELTKRDDSGHPSHLASKVLEEADEKFKLKSFGVEGWAKSPSIGYQYLNYGDPYDATIVVRSNPTRATVIVALGGWASYAG